jgi:hypothetical protein
MIKEERERIDARLKEKGFFHFNSDYIKVQVDSTVADHKVDLIVQRTKHLPLQQYKINKVKPVSNYAINLIRSQLQRQCRAAKDFTIIDPENLFKPRVFDRTLYFKKGICTIAFDHNLS